MNHGPDCDECYKNGDWRCRHCDKPIRKEGYDSWFHVHSGEQECDFTCAEPYE